MLGLLALAAGVWPLPALLLVWGWAPVGTTVAVALVVAAVAVPALVAHRARTRADLRDQVGV